MVETGDAEYMVRSDGFIRNISDLQNIPVGIGDKGVAILIKDVARVQLGPQTRRGIAELNGQGEVVGGVVVMRSGQNAMQTIENVKTKIQQVKAGLPPGVEIIPTYDRSGLIERAVNTLKDKLVEEFLLVSLICVLFLFHLRSALVIIISLPIGILMALVIMRWQGINANIMSLGGIAIAIGAMVDAAVVMVENVHKHLEKENANLQNRWQIIREACYEVAPPLFYSLLIITFSFLPIFTLQAHEGKLFIPLAFTKTFSMATAALLSITLVPILMGWFIRGKIVPEQNNPINKFLHWLYKPIIHIVIQKPKIILVLAVILVGVGLWPLTQLGKEFMPALDEGDILYMPTTLPSYAISPSLFWV